jgi:phage protein U
MIFDVLLAIGPVIFQATRNGYENLKRSTAFNWIEIPLLNRAPAYQYTGEGAESVTIEGVFYSAFTVPEIEEALLRSIAKTGEPYFLISAIGEILGRFFIENLEFSTPILNSDGTAKIKNFSISLKKFD